MIKKNCHHKIFLFLLTLSLLILPGLVLGADMSFKIENPIKADNFETFLSDILSIVVKIGVPILVFMTILVGFQFVTARGNEGAITKAKGALFGLLIGAFIVLGAFAISQALQNTVADLGFSTPTTQ